MGMNVRPDVLTAHTSHTHGLLGAGPLIVSTGAEAGGPGDVGLWIPLLSS
jgi:hypothetical protein